MRGRRCKSSSWFVAVKNDLVSETYRLKKIGIKYSGGTFISAAEHLILHSTRYEHNDIMRSTKCQKRSPALVNSSQIPRIIARNNILMCRQTEKLHISSKFKILTEKRIDYIFGGIACKHRSVEFVAEHTEMLTKCNLWLISTIERLWYFVLMSMWKMLMLWLGDDMKMMVSILGWKDARTEHLFTIFKSKDCSYPIRVIAGNFLGVSYLTRSKDCIDQRVMYLLVQDRRPLLRLENNDELVLLTFIWWGKYDGIEFRL